MRRFLFALTLVLMAISIVSSYADDEALPSGEACGAVGLNAYKLIMGPIEIDRVQANASGLTFSKKTGTLFAVTNSPEQLLELSTVGVTLRIIKLVGFDDTEGVVHIEGNTFAVTEERRFLLTTFELGDAVTEVQHGEERKVSVDVIDGDTGLEGIAYEAAARRFFGIKEKDPMKTFFIPWAAVEGEGDDIPEPWNAEENSFGLSDLSGAHFDASSGNLLIVSDESCVVVEITPAGKEVSRLSLKEGSAGLKQDIPQPEGVAMDAEGNLYICSEPNLFYRFGK